MTRTSAVNFSGALQFPMADAGTDIFVKEDVQTLAKAVDQHDHSAGKGLVLPTSAIPPITSAMIQDGTIQDADIGTAGGGIAGNKINWALATDGTIPGSKIQDNSLAYTKLAANAATLNGYYRALAGNVTTSTTAVLIPGTQFTLNVLGSAAILFFGSTPIYANVQGGQIFLYLFLDGGQNAVVAFANATGSSQTDQVAFFFQTPGGAFTAGNHTFGLGWSTQAGCTLTQNAAANTTFGAIELRR